MSDRPHGIYHPTVALRASIDWWFRCAMGPRSQLGRAPVWPSCAGRRIRPGRDHRHGRVPGLGPGCPVGPLPGASCICATETRRPDGCAVL